MQQLCDEHGRRLQSLESLTRASAERLGQIDHLVEVVDQIAFTQNSHSEQLAILVYDKRLRDDRTQILRKVLWGVGSALVVALLSACGAFVFSAIRGVL
jgi:hypothetical protein